MRYLSSWVAVVLVTSGCGGIGQQGEGETEGLRCAAFECDVTPPVGHPLCGGGRKPAESILAPLLAKGVVLSDGPEHYVVCVMDWCRLQSSAYDALRSRIAAAAGTVPSHVALQTVHCHEAPLVELRAQELLEQTPSPPVHVDLAYFGKVGDNLTEAIRNALRRMKPFTRVGWGKGRVREVASNSRVWLPGEKLMERPSVTNSPALQAEPEGKIDPWIRTVTLLDGRTPLLRMHYYACHPENSKTEGKVSPDFFGPLRLRLEGNEHIPHLYFSGCGGDVGMGKYHINPAEDCQARAIDRISAGILEATRSTETALVTRIGWKTSEARLVPREEPDVPETELRQRMSDPAQPEKSRIAAAILLARRSHFNESPGIEITCLRLGPVSIVHLPGEPFVEYQLYAQGQSSGFVAVAGYGDGGPGYICTDLGYKEGGYQPSASKVWTGTEPKLKEAITDVLL